MAYYAAHHTYGVEFCNDYDTLFRFSTKAERDAYVEDSNFDEAGAYGGYRTETVNYKDARRHFPNAFRMFDLHDEADERDWMQGATETSAYWCKSNIYC